MAFALRNNPPDSSARKMYWYAENNVWDLVVRFENKHGLKV